MTSTYLNRSGAIREWMRARAGQRFTVAQVASATGFDRPATRKTLSNLVVLGHVIGPGKGRSKQHEDHTYEWRLVVVPKASAKTEDPHKRVTACPPLPPNSALMALPPAPRLFVEMDAATYWRVVNPNRSSL
jgi:hypothetical protein